MRLPDVARRIRSNNYRVILDEAQDTDPQQFFVLLEVSRSTEATGAWMEDPAGLAGPRPGHFCMVGDSSNQSIATPLTSPVTANCMKSWSARARHRASNSLSRFG